MYLEDGAYGVQAVGGPQDLVEAEEHDGSKAQHLTQRTVRVHAVGAAVWVVGGRQGGVQRVGEPLDDGGQTQHEDNHIGDHVCLLLGGADIAVGPVKTLRQLHCEVPRRQQQEGDADNNYNHERQAQAVEQAAPAGEEQRELHDVSQKGDQHPLVAVVSLVVNISTVNRGIRYTGHIVKTCVVDAVARGGQLVLELSTRSCLCIALPVLRG